MADIATLPNIFALSPDERRAAYADAAASAMEAGREAAIQHKARKPDPRSVHDYRGYHSIGLVCVLVVKHRDKPASIECSRDGSAYPRLYLPTSKSIVLQETTGDFALLCLPKWLAQKSELMGVTPELCADRPWTDAQRKTWDALRKLRLAINTKIYFANKRPSSVLTRSEVA